MGVAKLINVDAVHKVTPARDAHRQITVVARHLELALPTRRFDDYGFAKC